MAETFDASTIRNVVLLPPWLLELQKEVLHHHKHLIEKYDLVNADYTVVLGALAAEVNIVVDGMFDAREQSELAKMILTRLQNRRSIIITPDPSQAE